MLIGYTTGVFDMFHVGHLNLIRAAKAEVDKLVVGVSTDALCLSYKERLPVISFADRFKIVESIKYVDLAIPQSELNKVTAWQRIKFNILFVGDDWKGSDKWNAYEADLSKFNVSVRYLPYTKNISSSNLRLRLESE